MNRTMALTLYFHPLSSFCQKALIALYELEVAFEPLAIDLMDPASRAKLTEIWPLGKFPVLRDGEGRAIPEATIIVEVLAQRYPGRVDLVPADPELAREVRLWDRFFDLYVNTQVGRIVGDRLRPEGQHDPRGVEDAKKTLRTAYDVAERQLRGKTWAVGEGFTMADCAAAPALFYAEWMVPFAATHRELGAYRQRLMERPSYARALREAEPFLKMVPRE